MLTDCAPPASSNQSDRSNPYMWARKNQPTKQIAITRAVTTRRLSRNKGLGSNSRTFVCFDQVFPGHKGQVLTFFKLPLKP